MTSHELAHYLLEGPDLPLVTKPDDGDSYENLTGTCQISLVPDGNCPKYAGVYQIPRKDQQKQAFRAVLVS